MPKSMRGLWSVGCWVLAGGLTAAPPQTLADAAIEYRRVDERIVIAGFGYRGVSLAVPAEMRASDSAALVPERYEEEFAAAYRPFEAEPANRYQFHRALYLRGDWAIVTVVPLYRRHVDWAFARMAPGDRQWTLRYAVFTQARRWFEATGWVQEMGTTPGGDRLHWRMARRTPDEAFAFAHRIVPGQGRELLLMTGFTRAERAEALNEMLDALIDSLDFSPGRRDRP
ncbi:MAG: hypothetical protein ACOC3I_06480 [Verrucomicrobiota bacterium]